MSSNIDLVIGFCFLVLVVLGVFLAIPLWRLLDQSTRTLGATENLINTLDQELGPTIKEVDNVLVTVNEFRSIAQRGITDVGTRVDDVTGNIGKVADQAKNETKVFGTGLFAGITAYFSGKHDHEGSSSSS